MKRIFVLLLAMFLLIPFGAAFAAGADYVLEIEGGQTEDHMDTVDGRDCLKVEVRINGVTAAKSMSALYFELCYEEARLTPVQAEPAASTPGAVNFDDPGVIKFAFASATGVTLQDGAVLLSLWFEINDGLAAGTEIAFSLGDSEAESYVSGKTAIRTVGSAFTPYTHGTPIAVLSGTVVWNAEDVRYKETTPYVIANGSAQTPRFTVMDDDGNVVDPASYEFTFRENTQPGTAYLSVTFKNGYEGDCSAFFKIYLPATTATYAENTKDGIRVTWKPVEGAAGYVVYRRAWSSTTNGWTAFARWDNTTETTYLDGHDSAHKVFAGTRYQYGVKAYFAKRYDPIADAYIGGNENAPLGNYNLGLVGPMATTVRITTRELVQLRTGKTTMTVKWNPSKVFTGYQIQLATDSKFTQNTKVIKISDPTTYWTTVDGLKSNTTYYVRIRSYHEFEGMTYFGGWSDVMREITK